MSATPRVTNKEPRPPTDPRITERRHENGDCGGQWRALRAPLEGLVNGLERKPHERPQQEASRDGHREPRDDQRGASGTPFERAALARGHDAAKALGPQSGPRRRRAFKSQTGTPRR